MGSAAALGAGATANLVRFSGLARRDSIPEKNGFPIVTTCPSRARFRFGDGRLGEVRRAADSPVWVAGNKGKFTAFVLAADIPSLWRTGGMEALAGQLNFSRDTLVLREQGATIPLRVNRMGHFSLSVVDFGKDSSKKVRGPVVSAS